MRTKQAVVAGTFYPDDKNMIIKMFDKYFSDANAVDQLGEIRFAVAPHAGYIYSGPVAAYVYKSLKATMFKKAIVISPSHYTYFEGYSILDAEEYQTPLGTIPLAKESIDKLLGMKLGAFHDTRAYNQEHALEVQLPFLQYINNDFSLIPIIMGSQNSAASDNLAELIAEVADDDTVVIASSDLSHFYPKFLAKEKDGNIISAIEKYDIDGLQKAIDHKDGEACGAGPIITVMKAAAKMGAKTGKVLNYADSGDISGDNSSVVGYMSAVFF